MKTNVLHILEPGLTWHDSHYFSFFEAVCDAGAELEIHIWADKRFRYESKTSNIHVHPYFNNKYKKWQFPVLIGRLFKREGKIFVATAETTYLLALKLLFSDKSIPENKLYFFFHIVRMAKKRRAIFDRRKRKERFYARVARKIHNLVILAPTKFSVDFFKNAGYRHVYEVPYPINPKDYTPQLPGTFDHLLFSGIPRMDKGLSLIAELIEHLARTNSDIPIVMQITNDFSYYQPEIQETLQRILDMKYKGLKVLPHGIDYKTYKDLFQNAISLQPYDPVEFADRVSGVSLDALLNGAPVITRKGTWNSRLVDKYGAGISLESADLDGLLEAIDTIKNNYNDFVMNANRAGMKISEEHSATRLLEVIFQKN